MVKVTKKGNKSWVTFTILPQDAKIVVLCGDWSDWKNEPMKSKKNGEFYLTKILKSDNAYQFGYKINGENWICDDTSELIDSPFNSKNSLLKI